MGTSWGRKLFRPVVESATAIVGFSAAGIVLALALYAVDDAFDQPSVFEAGGSAAEPVMAQDWFERNLPLPPGGAVCRYAARYDCVHVEGVAGGCAPVDVEDWQRLELGPRAVAAVLGRRGSSSATVRRCDRTGCDEYEASVSLNSNGTLATFAVERPGPFFVRVLTVDAVVPDIMLQAGSFVEVLSQGLQVLTYHGTCDLPTAR